MSDLIDNDQHLAAQIAWLYHHEGLTQDAIARRVGLTRARVNRILGQAREQGLVSVGLNYRFTDCIELEDALRRSYALVDARVVPTSPDADRLIDHLGAAGAHLLDRVLEEGDTLALGWGRTIAAVGRNLPRRSARNNTVVSLYGGATRGYALNPYDLTARFGEILDAQRHYLTAPMFMESSELRDALSREPSIRQVISMIVGAKVALLSATDLSDDSKSMVFGLFDASTRHSLLSAGVVGECGGIYLDAAGRSVSHPLTRRMIAPSLDAMRGIPKRILASGGPQKVAVIRACLLAGLGNLLVTDTDTARALLP